MALQDGQPVFVGRTLIYPIRNQRAEDVADALYPIFQAQYGPHARVIPHVATNSLFIYLPSRREREESMRSGGAGQARQPQPQPQVPRTTQPPARPPAGRTSRAQQPGLRAAETP